MREIFITNFNFRSDFLNKIIQMISSKFYLNIGKIKYKFKFKLFISFNIPKNFLTYSNP